MDRAAAHDNAVEAIGGALAAFFRGRANWAVLARTRWSCPAVSPGYTATSDVLIAPAVAPVVVTPDGAELCPGVVPAAVFEVITHDGWEEEYYDKPDLYMNAGVREYYLFDPTAEAMRPPFQVWRLIRGVYSPVGTDGYGVVFSELGFRLDLNAGEFRVSACGPADLEEELFDCERYLAEARERADREQRAIVGLTTKISRLRAQLAGAGS